MATHVYQVSVAYNSGGQFAVTTHHWQFDDAGFTSTKQAASALCTAFKTAVQPLLVAVLPAAVTVLTYSGRAVNQSGGFEAVIQASPSNVGTRSGALQAAGIGPVILYYPVALHRIKGRTFIPGISVSDALDGIIITALRVPLLNLGQAMGGTLTLSGGGAPVATGVIYSRKPANVAHVINQIAVSDMLGQQRRRQVPVG